MTDDRAKREAEVAERHGGRSRPASGAFWGLKRDVRKTGVFLMEHKETNQTYFRFDSRDFVYLMKQCADPIPVYLIEFTWARGQPIYAVPGDWFEERDPDKALTTDTMRVTPETVGLKVAFNKVGWTILFVDEDGFREIVESEHE